MREYERVSMKSVDRRRSRSKKENCRGEVDVRVLPPHRGLQRRLLPAEVFVLSTKTEASSLHSVLRAFCASLGLLLSLACLVLLIKLSYSECV